MTYTFETLSHADFEDLARDLLGKALDLRFEAFAQGPDGGMDGRHASGQHSTILQAKHFRGSSFSSLLSTMKRERASIDRLNPSRYILATSRSLTPKQKAKLAEVIGPALKAESDIYGAEDLNHLLRRYPGIERAHIKLWLSSTVVLDRVVRSASHAFNDITRHEIEKKVSVYAQNPSFENAQRILESTGVLIVSGPPGVGKTTLAEMLAIAYIAEGWDLVAIRGLDDGFAAIDDEKKQVFFFDDFLGKVALDARALADKESQLTTFLSRVRRSPNSRFILTTRAYIFEEARRVSEHLADRRLDISKYVLDVSEYTRAVRARILYNHLVASNLPKAYLTELIKDEVLKEVIDHENYNPRIIEWMTDRGRALQIDPPNYVDSFLDSLNNPSDIWDTAFRRHISPASQNLLIALFFCDQWGVEIDRLKIAFDAVHEVMCKTYGAERRPKDFEDSLKTLEGSFLSIRGKRVEFINPSVSDYLSRYLSDSSLLIVISRGARFIRWAEGIESHFTDSGFAPIEDLTAGFVELATAIRQKPVQSAFPSNRGFEEASNGSKLRAAIRWWLQTGLSEFLACGEHIAGAPISKFHPWKDGVPVLETLASLRTLSAQPIFGLVNALAIELFAADPDLDELQDMLEVIDENPQNFPSDIANAANEAINRALEQLPSSVQSVESESTLEDYLISLDDLAGRVSADASIVNRAREALEERMMIVRDTSDGGWTFDDKTDESNQFTDADVTNLFAPLLDTRSQT